MLTPKQMYYRAKHRVLVRLGRRKLPASASYPRLEGTSRVEGNSLYVAVRVGELNGMVGYTLGPLEGNTLIKHLHFTDVDSGKVFDVGEVGPFCKTDMLSVFLTFDTKNLKLPQANPT